MPPQDILIFIVGGATYEEAKVVQALNVQAKREGAVRRFLMLGRTPPQRHLIARSTPRPGCAGSNSRYILGGTTVMNSKMFTDVREGPSWERPAAQNCERSL